MPYLSTQKINFICSNHYHTQTNYRGVYSSNNIPNSKDLMKSTPWFIIINIDPSTSPGTHWVTIYCDNQDSISYFCSAGTKPVDGISQFLDNFDNIIINSKPIQDKNGTYCGEYCLFYADLRCLEFTDSEISHLFDLKTPKLNDNIIAQYVYSHMLK